MNITDYGFVLTKIEKFEEGISLYIDLIADVETKQVYLNNYYEGLYIGKDKFRLNVYSEIVDGQIVGKLMYETIDGLSTVIGENLHRLFIKNRVGNTYIENIVNLDIDIVDVAFGYKKEFAFISKTRQDFYLSRCNMKRNTNNPLRDVRDVREVWISANSEGISLNAHISENLLKIIEKEGVVNSLCLAWKDTKKNQKYYFHSEEVVDGILIYKLTAEEMNILDNTLADFYVFEWVMVDAVGREYRLYADDDYCVGNVILPMKDYHAEVFVCRDGYLQMTVMTSIMFQYTGVCYEGNGFSVVFKKRSYDLYLKSIIAQRVNTNMEYILSHEILDESDTYITYGIRLVFDVLQTDFKVGIHQFWVEFYDGLSVDRVPLKFIRENQITENIYLTTVHPYAAIGDYYYNCLFYNDSSNNLKCNIVPKRMKIRMGGAKIDETHITFPMMIRREPFFQNINTICLCAENGEKFNLKYSQDNVKENDRIQIYVSIPLAVLIDQSVNTTFNMELKFDNRELSVKIENNFYRPAVNNREISSFQIVKRLANGVSRKIWGNHQGSYLLGSTEDCGLFRLVGMWLYEEDKLCIRIEWLNKDFVDKYNDKQICLYLRSKCTGEMISFERELAVENEMIFKIPLNKVNTGEFLIYGKMPDGIVSYIENRSALYTLISESASRKVVLKNENGCLYIDIEELLLFESAEKVVECQEIIRRAQAENAGKNRKVWLVGENYGLSARDNGLVFFEYCMNRGSHIDAEVYFVTKGDNMDIDALDSYKEHTVIYDSSEHIYLDQIAEFYIVSHGIRDVMPSLYHNKIGTYRKNIIYLQHGVIAMKKIHISNESYGGSIRKFVVSSKQERDVIVENKQFWEDEVIITGMPRYDKLSQLDASPGNYIWIMPTWRDWLVKSEKEFLNSDFYKHYSKILEDETILRHLRKNGQKLLFSLHVEFEKYKWYFEKYENDVVHITDMHEKSIAELISQCRMMVTDYSSIIFDVVYLGKPALFFQFDQELYNKYRGSYVNLETDLPGKVVFTPEDLVVSLVDMIQSDYMVGDDYADRIAKYFDYHDCNNSMRIYEAIIECREEIADEY